MRPVGAIALVLLLSGCVATNSRASQRDLVLGSDGEVVMPDISCDQLHALQPTGGVDHVPKEPDPDAWLRRVLGGFGDAPAEGFHHDDSQGWQKAQTVVAKTELGGVIGATLDDEGRVAAFTYTAQDNGIVAADNASVAAALQSFAKAIGIDATSEVHPLARLHEERYHAHYVAQYVGDIEVAASPGGEAWSGTQWQDWAQNEFIVLDPPDRYGSPQLRFDVGRFFDLDNVSPKLTFRQAEGYAHREVECDLAASPELRFHVQGKDARMVMEVGQGSLGYHVDIHLVPESCQANHIDMVIDASSGAILRKGRYEAIPHCDPIMPPPLTTRDAPASLYGDSGRRGVD